MASRKRKRASPVRGAASRAVASNAGAFDASWQRRAMVGLVIVKIAGLILIFDPSADQAFELPKTLFSHGIALVLLAMGGVALVRWGTAIVPRHPLHLLVGLLLAANVASALTAANMYIAVFGESTRFLGVLFLLDMVVLYLAVAIAFRSSADWTIALGSIAVCAVVSMLYGSVQAVGLDPVRWVEVARPFGTFGNSNILGHFLSVVVALGVGVAVFYRGARALQVRIAGAALTLVAVAIAGGVVAARGTLVGVLAVLTLLPLAFLRARGTSGSVVRTILAGGVVAAVVLAGVVFTTPLGQRATETVRSGVGTQDRLLLYAGALAEFVDRPILGHGPDNFGVVYPKYRHPDTAGVFGPSWRESAAHNWVLQTAATTGAVGLIALASLVIGSMWSLFVRLGQLRRGDAVDTFAHVAPVLLLMAGAYWANALVSVGAPQVDWVPWVVFGGTAALGHASVRLAVVRNPHQAVEAAAITVAVVIAALGWSALAASHDIARSRAALAAGRGDSAAAAARSAIAHDSGRADYWNWLGLAHEQRKRASEASDAFAEAASRYPQEPKYWMNLALSRAREALAGRDTVDDAIAAARRAIEQDPTDSLPQATLAEVAGALGDQEVALRAALRAIELYPATARYSAIALEAASRLRDPRLGIPPLERALAIRDDATLRAALARLQLRGGDPAAARANALRALTLEENHPEARRVLADAQAP